MGGVLRVDCGGIWPLGEEVEFFRFERGGVSD